MQHLSMPRSGAMIGKTGKTRNICSLNSQQTASRSVAIRAGKDNGGSREPWDVSRFFKTVLFFNEPPTPQKVIASLLEQPAKLVQSLTGGSQPESTPIVTLGKSSSTAVGTAEMAAPRGGVVLVTGATGGVGKRVVQQLLAKGKHVRALVRDLAKAKQLLGDLPIAAGGKLEVAAGDITQNKTLLPEYFDGVSAAICCTAVKVQPKEGDTVDRQKYFQGIKFYDPEIVGDTPKTVELVGIRNLLAVLEGSLGLQAGKPLMSAADPGSSPSWGPLDDVVMGGVSKSALELRTGAGEEGGPAMVFSGFVSTSNSGGFASVRTKNFEPLLNVSAYEGLEVRLLGNGLRYKFIVRCDTNWDGIAHCCSFDTQPGVWQTIKLPFSSFTPVFRAKSLRDGPPLDPSHIASIQLMLSKFEYDGELNPAFRAGAFELPITAIRAYVAEPITPRIVHVSSAGVTRPNRPGIDVNVEPPAVRMNDSLGGILTFKLAGEDAIRQSGIPYCIVRPCALTEEPVGAPLQLDQGDVIKGKISRDEVADLCISLLDTPAATDATFEIKSTVPFSQPWEGSAEAVQRDWSAILRDAGIVPHVTGKTVDGRYTGKEEDPTALPATAKRAKQVVRV